MLAAPRLKCLQLESHDLNVELLRCGLCCLSGTLRELDLASTSGFHPMSTNMMDGGPRVSWTSTAMGPVVWRSPRTSLGPVSALSYLVDDVRLMNSSRCCSRLARPVAIKMVRVLGSRPCRNSSRCI
ncbi:hypothetical protein AMAG_18555 [Allomyces macrogynus ATCC 38327]|uniref:Uncharacterized protein n=1 Tax=Allomyces macrogynus (strain ATCC 38327) TaxID=578462 RepID=A0A0L0SDH6_ALLM3|nr:hypothetical protein AMAG_18555 [Allomyces macrogynus ATCC 38327]|eukprot:KNE60536.1 hypothetical protein AMAG_18555 [Allomyces macrogynus ATCC 38327]